MAQTKTTAEPKTCQRPGEELVEFMAPLLPGEDKQQVFVSVNGESLRLRRGEKVRIKRKFANALNDAARQQVEAHKASNAARRVEKHFDM